MKKRSIGVNAVLNMIQTVMSIIFPLITFPYISRTLGVVEVGKYNFSTSIISYFILIAGLGISTYAVREGSRLRDDKEKISAFVKDVFSINVYSTILSYLLLFFVVLLVQQLHPYVAIIAILSIQIISVTIGRSWIYTIYEDYLFVTIRSIAFQFLSMILLFVLVRSSDDVLLYSIVSVFNFVCNNIVNLFASRKYCKLKFTFKPDVKHLAPIFLIFSTAVSITIYGSSDTTILGFFCSDYNVGLYSVSVKIYTIVKQLVAAILIVTIPRFSYYLGINDKKAYKNLFINVFNKLVLVLLPVVIGLAVASKECILIVSGEEYYDAYLSLSILSIAMIFNLFSYMLGYCVLIPNREEKKFFKATMIGAIVNIVLNFIFIPLYMQNAAAVTTVIAEAAAALICLKTAKKYVQFTGIFKNLISVAVGCIWIILVCILTKEFVNNYILIIIIEIPISAIGFLVIQLLMKNETLIDFFALIMKKFRRNKRVNN